MASAAALIIPWGGAIAHTAVPQTIAESGRGWPHYGEADGLELRIVELRIRERAVLASEMLAYIDEAERLYLPFAELAALLDFPIHVAADGRATGWFLREKQDFTLDPSTGSVMLAGRQIAVAPGQVAWIDGALHIRSDALDAWLLLKSGWQADRQIATLNPPYLIAREESARRTRQGVRAGQATLMDTRDFVAVESDYGWISWPFVHVNIALGYDAQARPHLAAQGSFLADGDLLKHSARLALSADSRGLADGRMTLGRHDPQNRLLGPLGASLYEFGDVAAPQVPLIQRSLYGVGVRLAREPADLGGRFDQIDLVGDAPPGWQAELYRDSELLGFQIIGADGRYDFRDTPLSFGVSRFRIQLYGPSGERQTIYRTVDIDAAALRPGELRYSLTAMRQGHSLFNGAGPGQRRQEDDDPLRPPGLFDREATYLEARGSLGISRMLGIRGVLSHRRPDDRRQSARSSLGLGARLSFGRLLIDGDGVIQNGRALAARAAVATGFGRFRLSASHDQYDRDFLSDDNSFGADPLRMRSTVSLDGTLGAMGVGGHYARINQQDGTVDQSASIRINMLVAGFSVANRVGWRRYSGPLASRERLDGSFSLSGAIGPFRARFGADYEFDERLRGRRLRGEVSYRLDGWYLAVGHDREMQRGGAGQWSATGTRDWNGIRLGGELRHSQPNGGLRALLTISFALDRDSGTGRMRFGRDARSQRGTVDIRAFHDANGNGRWDELEHPVAGFAVEAEPRGLVRATPEEGRIRVEELPIAQKVAVRPILDGIDDPYLIPTVPGYLLSLRPGRATRVDVPLIESGEIELLLRSASGEPAPGITILLRSCSPDSDQPRSERTAHDGRLFFDRMTPGCYRADTAGQPELIVEPGEVTRAELYLPGGSTTQ